MVTDQDDGLFLLEVLIDKVIFLKKPCFPEKDCRTCVSIQCPSVPPLELCDDDPGTVDSKIESDPTVKNFDIGKSCLFSLKEPDIDKAMTKFPIKITVAAVFPCGCLPNKIVLGEASIDMTKEFVQARKNFLKDSSNVSYQALKDSFHIVGPDGSETGIVIMFLRISCFGKLIVTRFQAGKSPMNLTNVKENIMDQPTESTKYLQNFEESHTSRNLNVYYATTQTGQRSNVSIPTAGSTRDNGNKPCDPNKPSHVGLPAKVACRNTHEYCLHVPKGALLSLPLYQDLSEEQKHFMRAAARKQLLELLTGDSFSELKNNEKSFKKRIKSIKLPTAIKKSSTTTYVSNSTLSNSFNCNEEPLSKLCSPFKSNENDNKHLFQNNETTVYMTLLEENRWLCNSETQATASLNKCLQVRYDKQKNLNNLSKLNNISHSSIKIHGSFEHLSENIRHPEVYFFGKKSSEYKKNKPGMGCNPKSCKNESCCVGIGNNDPLMIDKYSGTNTSILKTRFDDRPHRTGRTTTISVKSSPQSIPKKPGTSKRTGTTSSQTRKAPGRSKSPLKSSSSKSKQYGTSKPQSTDKKKQSTICASSNKDMVATLSYIKVGPKKPCPIYGSQPCQGPNCMATSSSDAVKGPIKITTVPNARKGVFELVIRRLNEAPLAKNELMLEWTPPPRPCPPCLPEAPCRPNKYKLIMCRPSPCKPKSCVSKPCSPLYPKRCCRAPCPSRPCLSKPCLGQPCPSTPCPRCQSSPCRACCRANPCGPPCPRCKNTPCCGNPCLNPCIPSSQLKPPCLTCKAPCCSTPCLRPCPVGYGRFRKTRSQPKLRPYRKRTSPCLNRSKYCPAAPHRCPSGPCCSGIPCPPRKCCSVSPCKPPKICKSTCSTCC